MVYIVWIKIAFIKWMHIICLIYHFLEAALFWDVSASFWFFLLIINRESHSVVFVSTNEKRLQNQVYRQIKSKLMDTFGSGKSSLFERVDFSLCIISHLHFLNLNNILALPKLLPSLKLCLIWQDYVCHVFCLPDLHACTLGYEIKTNASHLWLQLNEIFIGLQFENCYVVGRDEPLLGQQSTGGFLVDGGGVSTFSARETPYDVRFSLFL